MEVAARTEIGHVRRRNEDSLLVDEPSRVVAVADGLGGHPCGDLASQTAVARLRDSLSGGPRDGEDPGPWLTAALLAAHEAVLEEAGDDPERAGMATTAVVACIGEGAATVAHVGDSRAYLLAGDVLTPVTRDHGLGGYITQALGLDRAVSPDVAQLDLGAGDRLLLCTDGLTNMLDDKGVAQLLGKGGVTDAVDSLVDAALANGGIDNVTVVVVEA